MAINWIEGVLENSQHTGSNLLLMILLAESANRDSGCCYPGVPTLARLMRCSTRNVQYRIAELVASGEVSVQRCGSHVGTNVYTLSPELLDTKSASPPSDTKSASPGYEEDCVTDTKPTSPKPLDKPLEEPLDTPRTPAKKKTTPVYTQEFESFWSRTWRAGSKLHASTAWTKLPEGDKQDIGWCLDDWVAHYAESPGYEKHVSSWLNARMWEGQLPRPKIAPNGHKPLLSEREWKKAPE